MRASEVLQARLVERPLQAAAPTEQSLQAAAPTQQPRAQRPGLAAVYEAELDYVFRCLRGLGVRDDMVDDALQDVFMVVADKLCDFDGRARLRTWLYAIALRVARRYRERSAKEARRFVGEEVAQHDDPAAAAQRSEDLELAHRALLALPDPKREVFVLSAVEQLSAPEIAAITELPVNTVYSRIRAARIAFDEQVARLSRAQRRRGA